MYPCHTAFKSLKVIKQPFRNLVLDTSMVAHQGQAPFAKDSYF